MHQGSGLQRLARRFVVQFLCRQFAELLVDQRQQALGGVRVALHDSG
jgi:hypothetical protein